MDFKRIITTNKWLQFGLLLVLNLVVFILCARILPISFLANDDVAMAWIANGVTSGTPDCHLIFMNAIYGSFLTLFYNIVPNIEWYSVFFAVFHIIAISIIILFFFNKIQNKIVRWVLICLFYLLWFRIIQFFQFTTTTAMLAFSGILLLVDRKYVVGGLILLISSMLRFDAAGLIGLLSIPLFIKSYRFEMKKYIPIAIILFVICGVHLSNNLFYQSEEWQEYCEYNHYRAIINDSPNNWILSESELPENISKENLQLLRNFKADPCQISNADMKVLAEIIDNTPFAKKCHNFSNTINHNQFYKLYLGIFILMFTLALFFADDRRNRILVAFAFILFISVLWYISLNGHIKQRILESVLFPLFSYVLLLGDRQNPLFSVRSILVVLPLLLSCGILFIHERACMRTSGISTKEEQLQLIAKTGNLKIINLNYDFQSELISPFHLYEFPKQKFIVGGWLTKSPFCEINSFREVVDSNIALFVKRNADISYFQDAIMKNYQIETEIYTIANTEHYEIVSLRSKNDN